MGHISPTGKFLLVLNAWQKKYSLPSLISINFMLQCDALQSWNLKVLHLCHSTSWLDRILHIYEVRKTQDGRVAAGECDYQLRHWPTRRPCQMWLFVSCTNWLLTIVRQASHFSISLYFLYRGQQSGIAGNYQRKPRCIANHSPLRKKEVLVRTGVAQYYLLFKYIYRKLKVHINLKCIKSNPRLSF